MKKNLKMLFIVIIILSLLVPITYSYALSLVQPTVNEKYFFEVSKTEVTKNEKVEMILNLDTIEYKNFIFELKSDEVIEDVEIVQSDEITTEKNNNEIVMEINKEKTNVKTINLYYAIPENKQIGDIIKFTATITSIINNENEEISKEESKLPTENDETDKEETGKDDGEISTETTKSDETNVTINKTENPETENKEENESETELNNPIQETQSIEVEIKIVEEKEDDKQEDNKSESQIPNTENDKQEIENDKMSDKNNASSSTAQKIPTSSSNYNSMSNISISNNQTAKVTYNGSDNNYLCELSVEGYTFNRSFSKENTTYFITVGNEIEKLDITTKVDDDEASVNIYGNESLKEGTNKILITVTAENGNVRNYRIYVTKNI